MGLWENRIFRQPRERNIMNFQNLYAGHFTAPEFKERVAQSRGVILVCGSCEQHGYHLPLDTDNIIGFELALRIADRSKLLVMPPVSYGQVWSAKDFPGTISLSADLLKKLLRELIVSLHQQDIPNIILMSGHNGNYHGNFWMNSDGTISGISPSRFPKRYFLWQNHHSQWHPMPENWKQLLCSIFTRSLWICQKPPGNTPRHQKTIPTVPCIGKNL